MNRFYAAFSSCLVILFFLASPTLGATPGPDAVELLDLLRAREFQKLSEGLAAGQAEFEADATKELQASLGFGAFDVVDVETGKLLDEWVAAMPDSWVPLVARAEHSTALAWQSRGTEWANETTDDQFAQMRHFFGKARKDCEAALAMNPKLSNAYVLLLSQAMATGDLKTRRSILDRALAEIPASYQVRRVYLVTIVPKWGGSYEAMAAFAKEAQKDVPLNSRIPALEGFVHADRGDRLTHEEKYAEAIAEFTKALGYGEDGWFWAGRAKAYMRAKGFEKAIDDIQRSLAINPDAPDAIETLVRSHAGLGQTDEALRWIEKLERIDPGTPLVLTLLDHVAYDHYRAKRYREAVEGLNRSIEREPDAERHHWRGMAYLQSGDLDAAGKDLEEAIRLDPHRFESYRMMDFVLFKKKRLDDIIAMWGRFLELEPKHAEAHLERAGTYRHKGDAKRSMAELEKACELGSQKACRILHR